MLTLRYFKFGKKSFDLVLKTQSVKFESIAESTT